MSPITKEQLRERARAKVKSLEFSITQTAFADSRSELEEELELARIALASLEAEAVGEVVLGEYDDCGCHPDAKVVCIAADGQADWGNFKDGTPLYTAPPAPASVPAAMEMDDDFDSAFEHGKAVGWNAYRAAMLQSFGNSEQLNSPVIPDGWKLVPIELTGDMTNAMSEAILDDLHNVDVWRSVLAAAPQQEAK
ncbi:MULTISPECIES: hypothetical protein [Enterobacter]|uniref:hypothetical protein n=1 Tax=Enterobacter TaxID=547 RepID=UPI0007354AEF|nr:MULTISPECIES: hypothetical protein [Enterobacter cloacae complex]KAA0855259.1 hypothetical protein EYC85_16430 [Enterobacter hormaechei]KAA0871902.1 hypothetical protein EYC91_04815 [Enterobacter hormaechei]KAA0899685.1 hypothetical protein EVS72_22900 [Enterobacter hormaechei]KAA0903951.1 hypothetical protein EYC88_19765 [Enterobacter hormaechei]KTH92059.1 hypothetical protein ASV15_08670 [Enterobacter hormaechei subsp. steigerwaltii]